MKIAFYRGTTLDLTKISLRDEKGKNEESRRHNRPQVAAFFLTPINRRVSTVTKSIFIRYENKLRSFTFIRIIEIYVVSLF